MYASNCNVVVWNVRGLNCLARWKVVCGAARDEAAFVVGLVESKLDVVSQCTVYQILGSDYDRFAALPAIGTAGGIIIAWRSSDVQVLAAHVLCFSVSILLKLLDGSSWWFTVVYGPCNDDLRDEFL